MTVRDVTCCIIKKLLLRAFSLNNKLSVYLIGYRKKMKLRYGKYKLTKGIVSDKCEYANAYKICVKIHKLRC